MFHDTKKHVGADWKKCGGHVQKRPVCVGPKHGYNWYTTDTRLIMRLAALLLSALPLAHTADGASEVYTVSGQGTLDHLMQTPKPQHHRSHHLTHCY